MSRLPILMYHNVCSKNEVGGGLTISAALLEKQFAYIQSAGYTTLFFEELKDQVLNSKILIITFDDVTLNQLQFAYPLLQKYNLKATFFIPFQFVGGYDEWQKGSEKIMNLEHLKSLDPNLVQLGHHSFSHPKFHEMEIEDIENEIIKCNQYITENDLSVEPVIAYPYGKYPRDIVKNKAFKNVLSNFGIQYGLRIGNKVNAFPFEDNYEVKRIDIRGNDTLFKFKIKLKFGKLKLF